MDIVFAVNECDSSQCDIILPADVVDELRALTICDVISVDENNVDKDFLTVNNAIQSNDQNVKNIVLDEIGSSVTIVDGDRVFDRSSTADLIAEQRADVSLQPVLKLAKNNKHG
jgi:hypothetical protein